MNKISLILTAGVITAGFATHVIAGNRENHGEIHHQDLFKNYDTDGSGGISGAEMMAAHKAMDTDGDGEVSQAEFGGPPEKE